MAADPDTLILLTTVRTEFEGSALCAVLEEEGIPARVFAASANMLQWEGGYTNPIKVMVRRADAVRAAEALATNRRSARMVDWSRVDVGEFEEGDAPSPQDPVERSMRRTRIRRAGFILMALGLALPALSVKIAIVAIAGAAFVIALSWNDEV
jgi:hypothetical protein